MEKSFVFGAGWRNLLTSFPQILEASDVRLPRNPSFVIRCRDSLEFKYSLPATALATNSKKCKQTIAIFFKVEPFLEMCHLYWILELLDGKI